MDILQSMRIFCAVAELRSFTAAADRLDLAHSAVSKHVAMLERRLSARLLNRTSRHVSLTEAGALYLEQARRALDSIEEMEESVRDAAVTPFGILKISAPPWLADAKFVALLANFQAANPKVRINIDLIERGNLQKDDDWDIALRLTRNPEEGMVSQLLTTLTFWLVAAPSFMARQRRPCVPKDVDGWPLLHYSGYPTDEPVVLWGGESIAFKTIMLSSSAALLYLAVNAGMGPAFMPAAMVERDVAEGRLELVLPERTASPVGLYAIYPRRSYVSNKVKAFLGFLEAAYR